MSRTKEPARPSGEIADRDTRRVDLPTSIVGSLLVVLLVVLHLANPAVIEAFRHKVFDELQSLHPRPPQQTLPITIVDIDDASLARIGQWPWPRSVFAQLFDKLGEYGARSITCDILFPESDRYSPPVFAQQVEGVAPELAASLRGLPDNDTRMAEAMARNQVVLGAAAIPTSLDAINGAKLRPSPVVVLGEDPRQFLPEFAGLVGALPSLSQAAAGLGLVTLTPDVDGIVRRVPLIGSVAGQLLPSLALETLRIAVGVDKVFVRSAAGGLTGVTIAGVTLPVDPVGRAWVRYADRRQDQYVSAADVLEGTVAPDRFEGHVVLIGASAAGLGDIKAVPIVGNMPGVEIQVSLLHTLLSGTILRRPFEVVQLENLTLIVLGLVLAWAGPFMRASYLPPLLALVAAGGLGATWYAFRYHEVLVDGVYVAAALAVLLFWLAMARYVREEARRRTIRNAFSRYLSPVMVDRLASSARALKIGGERRDLTVLFSDIRAFTTLSERYEDDPEGLTALLGRYFTAMTLIIQENSGTIDKYIGDAIMAFWNAPLPVDQHARQACLAALRMREGLGEFNAGGGGGARGPGRTLADWDRPEHGRLLRRQHGLRAALQLLGDRRPGERGLAHRGPLQGLRARHRDRRDHAASSRGSGDARDRPGAVIGQDHGHTPVCADRRPERRPQRAVRGAGRRAQGDAGCLSLARVGRRHGQAAPLPPSRPGLWPRRLLRTLRPADRPLHD